MYIYTKISYFESISSGANVVLEYASKYHDIGGVINVSGRYDPRHIDLKSKRGIFF